MFVSQEAVFQNRKHAAFLLGERLLEYRSSDSIVVAAPGGGVRLGAYLSQYLSLSLDVIPCRRIKHPADDRKTIGAVSIDTVVLEEQVGSIPQDYAYHQIQLLQHVINMQARHYAAARPAISYAGKTVIVVDDSLSTSDVILACVRALKNRKPSRIVVAVPHVTPGAAERIASSIDEIIYLSIEPHADTHRYTGFPAVSEEEVIEILRQHAG